MKKLMSFLLLFFLLPGAALAEDFIEGKHYKLIVPEQPTNSATGRIEVVELFWYGCPHCHRFQAYAERWLKTKPADVDYVRMPAVFNPLWGLHANAFYTAEALGVLDKIHKPLFDAMHVEKRRVDTEDLLRKFFGEYGVSEADFKKTFHSFAVESKVRRAQEMSRRYKLESTPSVVVNGKYLIGGEEAGGSYPTMIKIIDFLIEKERAAKKS